MNHGVPNQNPWVGRPKGECAKLWSTLMAEYRAESSPCALRTHQYHRRQTATPSKSCSFWRTIRKERSPRVLSDMLPWVPSVVQRHMLQRRNGSPGFHTMQWFIGGFQNPMPLEGIYPQVTKGSPLGDTLSLSCEASVGTSGSNN